VRDDEILVVSVSRLSVDLKLDALTDVIDGVAGLARNHPIRLILVGDGDAGNELARRAAAVNAVARRPVVELAGPMLDPRAAYAAADIVAGMGSSALRGMAHAKPVVVQGERGFARTFDAQSAPEFLYSGFYGIGAGGSAAGDVAASLAPLVVDRGGRDDLGRFGREVVEARFSLQAAGQRVVALYQAARVAPPRRGAAWGQAITVGGRAAANEARLHLPRAKHRRQARRRTRLARAASPT
jgi:glycosyltransferase involved in cell wall biosynthesis